LGVRFFFTISGFLITWLLLKEFDASGSISLRNFYIRRAFRILPVYVAFIVVLFLLQLFTPFHQTFREWLGNLTFTTNFSPATTTSGHFWSLAVEEQFYLLWPILMVSLGLTTNIKRAAVILAIPIVVAPCFRIIAYKGFYPNSLSDLFRHTSFFGYFDTLAMGCGCAIVAFRYSERMRAFFASNSKSVPIIGVLLLLIPSSFGILAVPGRIVQAVTFTLQFCGFALLLLQSVFFPQLRIYRWLNWRWVRHIGVLSYSIYIWQQIFHTDPQVFGIQNTAWKSFPVWWLSVFAAGHLSYYGLERPFLKLREAFRRPRRNQRLATLRTAGGAETIEQQVVEISTR
jgi:peptidoglycan/LPS O-acetylase OafA/YrhL